MQDASGMIDRTEARAVSHSCKEGKEKIRIFSLWVLFMMRLLIRVGKVVPILFPSVRNTYGI